MIEAMIAIEKDNENLKGVLPKDYGRPALNAVMLGELIDLISGVALHQGKDKARDLLGRVYEYFLGQFAGSEGKRGGEFYTLRSVVRVKVGMIEPFKGRVHDPCCGSGGMFVQSDASSTSMAAALATSPSTGRSPIIPRGGCAR
jgi:type I restriction enzyme M protein